MFLVFEIFSVGLNTTMIENRKILNTADMDGFDKVGNTFVGLYLFLLENVHPMLSNNVCIIVSVRTRKFTALFNRILFFFLKSWLEAEFEG